MFFLSSDGPLSWLHNCIPFKYQCMFLLLQHLSRAEIQCVSGQEPCAWENSRNWFSGVFIPLPSYTMFWQLWSRRPCAFDGLSRMSNHTWGKFLFPLTLPLFKCGGGGTSRKERRETRQMIEVWVEKVLRKNPQLLSSVSTKIDKCFSAMQLLAANLVYQYKARVFYIHSVKWVNMRDKYVREKWFPFS